MKNTMTSSLQLLLLTILLILSGQVNGKRYPQDALKCHATAAATGETICPEHSNSFCIKEDSTTSRGECGTIQEHKFDKWDRRLGRCVYRKCSDTCNNGTRSFGDANQYDRSTYCCSSNMCNAAALPGATMLINFMLVWVAAFFLMIT